MYLRLFFAVLLNSLFCEILAQDCDDMAVTCEYSTDMSKVDPETCLRQLRELATAGSIEEGRIEECTGNLYYGAGMLYKGRDAFAHFSIQRMDNTPGYFPEDFTYTILRRKAPDWTVENSLTQIPGCERMTKNDVCTLPKKEKGESQYAYFPLNREGRCPWFCEYEIMEAINPELQTWCDIKKEVGCFFIDDKGELKQQGMVIPLSMNDVSATFDYCTFSMNEDYFDNEDRDFFAVDSIVFHNNNSSNTANASGELIPCTLRNNLTLSPKEFGDVLEKNESKEEYNCYFLRIPNNKWIRNPRCQKRSEVEASAVVAIIIVVATSVVVLGVLITMMWLYKTQLKRCTFKKNIEELPRPLAERPSVVEHESPERPDNNNWRKEIVDEITFSPVQDEDGGLNNSGFDKSDASTDKIKISRTNKEDVNSDDIAEVTPLCGGLDSGFHSMQNEGRSTKVSVGESGLSDAPSTIESTADSGMASLESNSGFAQTALPVSNGYTDKNSFKNPEGKASFPTYVKKNFLEQDSVTRGNMPSPAMTGYTAKNEIM